MRHKRAKTYEELLGQFVDSVPGLLEDIDVNIKQLEINGTDTDFDKLHRTRKLIKNWFAYNSRRYN